MEPKGSFIRLGQRICLGPFCAPGRGLAVYLLLCALPASGAHAAEPLEFRSLAVRQPTTPEQTKATLDVPYGRDTGLYASLDQKLHHKMAMDCGTGGQSPQVCIGHTSIANVTAEANVLIGANGCLQHGSLTIDSTLFDEAFLALTTKFGPPQSIRRGTVQNGFAPTLPQDTRVWNGVNMAQL